MANIYNFTDTWNNGLTTYSAIKCSVTDTASAADSALIDMLVGGTSMFRVQKDGEISTQHYYSARQALAQGTDLDDTDIDGSNILTLGADGNYFQIGGSQQIDAIASITGAGPITLVFTSARTLTHNGTSFILPRGANITTAAGDAGVFAHEGSGNWRCLQYLDADAPEFTSAKDTKLGYISVTQAVDLDQIEADIAALANGMVYQGNWDASSGSFPGGGAAQTGWFYTVSVGGTVDGQDFVAGDRLIATTDNASTTTYASNWTQLDATDSVTAVAGLTGSISSASLLSAIGYSTGDSPQLAGVNLGHASDTTLARASAGIMSVEGNHVPSPGSQAEGDILYHNGTTWNRLAKGTAEQVLAMNSGATAPEWVAKTSDLQLIASTDISNDAAVEFTGFDAGAYDAYLFVFTNVVPATDNVSFYVRLSNDAGSTFESGASYYGYRWREGGTDNIDATASQIQLAAQLGSAAGEIGINGHILLVGAGDAGKKTVVVQETLWISDSGTIYIARGGGLNNTAEANDAIQFLMSSGNCESGNISMYGFRSS